MSREIYGQKCIFFLQPGLHTHIYKVDMKHIVCNHFFGLKPYDLDIK